MLSYMIALHVLGALLFGGGPLLLLAAVLPYALSRQDLQPFNDFVLAWEKLLLPMLLLLLATGVALSWLNAPNIEALWDPGTAVGRLVLMKLGALALFLGSGYWLRYRLLPRLSRDHLGLLFVAVGLLALATVALVVLGVLFQQGHF
ncbi:CopD family protein [Gallaecimonas sp. GXIMD4217]|uniref:CopD family protein n=1 Tax=Gallaecimonas sp. GXIMD4217 TaxID=3131927 RepID=UPI00311B1CB3